ncbi:MAG: hypothetical protein ACAH83_16115 [Alphaproteobacteria bacterium]
MVFRPKIDRYQLFGLFSIAASAFFMLVAFQGSARLLFIGGFAYGLLLLFHKPAERLARKYVAHPLRAYGIGVVVNGMLMEVLAYTSSLDRIARGEKVPLFSHESLAEDLAIGLPYYIILAGVFCWSVRRYALTAFELGAVIFLFWAIAVDEFVHLRNLFQGAVLEFLLAGLLMVFTLHGSIVIFEKQLQEAYPNRRRGWQRFAVPFCLQILSFAAPVAAIGLKLLLAGRF